MYTVLSLFKETVLLGLWESIVQFRKLIPLFIMRIIKIENNKIFDNEEKEGKSGVEIVAINK